MNRHHPFLLLVGAIVIAAFVAAFPRASASAETCFDAQHPNGFPCPKKERPTVIYPSFTPSATFTPVPSDTPTPAPTLTPTSTATGAPAAVVGAAPAAAASPSSGFTCPPYSSSVPLGAALLGLGLMLVVGGSRMPGAGMFLMAPRVGNSVPTVSMTATTNPGSASGGADQESPDELDARAPGGLLGIRAPAGGIFNTGPGATQTATPLGPPAAGAVRRLATQLARRLALLSPRDPASGLPSVNQGGDAAAAAVQGTGVAATGAGAGLLGAGVLAGLLGVNCVGAPILLPTAATAGLIAALIGTRGFQSGRSEPQTVTADGDLNIGDYSTFELVGSVLADGSVSGSAGLYSNKDLE